MESIETRMKDALVERIGRERQEKLFSASVVICGLGGLGSNVAIALARAGVRKLHIIDFDRVDISNLNRQQYFPEQLGMPKTDALEENLKHIAPGIQITKDFVKLDRENIPELLKNEDIICEAFDNPEAKAMLVETALLTFPDKYVVSASGMAGFDSANSIQTRRLMKRLYVSGDMENDVADGIGLVSSRVLVAAGHEANTIIRLILGMEDA